MYKYCYVAKQLDETKKEKLSYKIPRELVDAVKRLGASDVYAYLSNSVPESNTKNRIWRAYWFKYMANSGVLTLYDKVGTVYEVHHKSSSVKTVSGSYRTFFVKTKKRLVEDLNSGKITENEAWEKFAKNIRDRAHSYRIDVETFTYGIGLVDSEYKLTRLGYRYVNSCVKGDPFEDFPKKIFAAACLNNGNMNVFLQFFQSVSEEKLSQNALLWSKKIVDKNGNIVGYKFDDDCYRKEIEDEFINLHIIKKVSPRKGRKRPPLKAEICLLKLLGITDGNYRVGAGLPLDWSEIQSLNDFYNNNRLGELEG